MFSFSNIKHFQRQLNEGTTTCLDAVDYYLQRIDEYNHLNAFVNVYHEEARARAKMLDEKRKSGQELGALHGVILSIKDLISYQDHVITAGSKMLKDFKAIYDATAVARLRAADAIIIGSCNCDEFGMGSTNEKSIHGRVKNGLDESKVSGGSSGGSAVAIQMNLCMVSLGTDTGGSVRQPADFCGVIGYKPSYGTISRYGLFAYASSFDQIGILAHNIEDIRLVMEVISGPDEYDSTANTTQLDFKKVESKSAYRFLVFDNAVNHPALDSEIKDQTMALSRRLNADGHSVTFADFDLLDYIVPTYYILTTAEASSNLSRYDGVRFGYRTSGEVTSIEEFYKKNRAEGFGPEVKKRILLGTFVLSSGFQDAYFTKAQQVRQRLIEETSDFFDQYDAILIPTVTSTAFTAGDKNRDTIQTYLCDIYTVFANLTGIAGISLPLFQHSNGMPFGIQLLSARKNDPLLLDISNLILNNYAK